jgi:hypothetical protein
VPPRAPAHGVHEERRRRAAPPEQDDTGGRAEILEHGQDAEGSTRGRHRIEEEHMWSIATQQPGRSRQGHAAARDAVVGKDRLAPLSPHTSGDNEYRGWSFAGREEVGSVGSCHGTL